MRRQFTPGLISSLLGTAGLPPFISFSTSYLELDSGGYIYFYKSLGHNLTIQLKRRGIFSASFFVLFACAVDRLQP